MPSNHKEIDLIFVFSNGRKKVNAKGGYKFQDFELEPTLKLMVVSLVSFLLKLYLKLYCSI